MPHVVFIIHVHVCQRVVVICHVDTCKFEYIIIKCMQMCVLYLISMKEMGILWMADLV